MALPMIHLLAAQLWAQDKPGLRENPDYYLGALSPDAIHIRDGNDKSHKNEIHLNNWRTPDVQAVLDYWRDHNAPFDIGYGIHVLLDGLWAQGFRRDFPEMLLPNGKPDPDIYYNDTCVTDFAIHDSLPETPFLMDMVRRGRAPEDHPLLTAHEFDAWRQEILSFYDRPCPMNGPQRFITLEYVRAFLPKYIRFANEIYERMLNMNETLKSILDRRSNRGFTGMPLTDAEVQMFVDVALASPTACNYQDWHFCFVRNQEMLKEFSDEFRAFLLAKTPEEKRPKYAEYDVFFNAPLVVFITMPQQPKSRFAQVDAGIAVENLAIAAQGAGMGSVILGRPLDVLNGPKGAEWEKRLGFPEGHKFAIAIALGRHNADKAAHPAGENKISFVD